MRTLVTVLLVLASACSTSSKVRYMGSGVYSVITTGKARHSQDDVQSEAIKQAYTTCRDKHGLGFKLLTEKNETEMTALASNCGTYGCQSNVIRRPTSQLRFSCSGPVDTQLEAQYADEN